MGRSVVPCLYLIAGPSQHRAIRCKDDRANRHLAPSGGGASFFQRDLHRSHAVLLAPQWPQGLATAT